MVRCCDYFDILYDFGPIFVIKECKFRDNNGWLFHFNMPLMHTCDIFSSKLSKTIFVSALMSECNVSAFDNRFALWDHIVMIATDC